MKKVFSVLIIIVFVLLANNTLLLAETQSINLAVMTVEELDDLQSKVEAEKKLATEVTGNIKDSFD